MRNRDARAWRAKLGRRGSPKKVQVGWSRGELRRQPVDNGSFDLVFGWQTLSKALLEARWTDSLRQFSEQLLGSKDGEKTGWLELAKDENWLRLQEDYVNFIVGK